MQNRSTHLLIAVGVVALALAGLPACSGSSANKSIDYSGLSATPRTTPTPTPVGGIGGGIGTPTPTPPPTATPTPPLYPPNFTITSNKVTNDTATTWYMHEGTTLWGSNCAVESNETVAAKKDLVCYLDVPEQDLYLEDFSLDFGAPPDMCTWINFEPFWFFQYKPGIVTGGFSTNTNAAGTTTFSSVLAGVSLQGGSPVCDYDYTGSLGPNCCQGNYTWTQVVNNADGTSQTVVKAGNWGGKVTNCIDGPAVDPKFSYGHDDKGFPLIGVFNAVDGLSKSFGVQAPNSRGFVSNRSVANSIADFTAPPAGMRTTINGAAKGPLYYTLSCLNRQQELLARIRLVIREWNLSSEFAKKQLGDPNTTGTEPDFPDQFNNDRYDWDDTIDPDRGGQSLPGGYPGIFL